MSRKNKCAPETPAQLAEQAGHMITWSMNNVLLNAKDQAQALTAIHEALNEAFNPDNDEIVNAVAAGFAVGIVNVMERGWQAIKADGDRHVE
jgi:hypothetical protein